MTSRTFMTRSELQEIYSTDSFSYDFEHIISWSKPFTHPIALPEISGFSIDELKNNAEAFVQDVISKVEATRPKGTPGYDDHILRHKTKINEIYFNKTSRLYKKGNSS